MKNLTWQNPEQLFVAQELINKVKSKCCGIKDEKILSNFLLLRYLKSYIYNSVAELRILKQLKQEGIHIERIEAYEYPEVRDIKHLFIRFEKEKEDTPFYLLSPEIFSKLTNAIIQEYSSNIK